MASLTQRLTDFAVSIAGKLNLLNILKQDKLIPGEGISIAPDGKTISSTVSGGAVDSVAGKTGVVTLDASDISGLANVSKTGHYNDLSGKPAIPSKTSDITNDSEFITAAAITGKQDKEAGKGLSEENYTTAEKTKLAGIAAGAEVNVNADWNATSGDAQILNKPALASVATSGSYNDLSNKPTLNPTTGVDVDFVDNDLTIYDPTGYTSDTLVTVVTFAAGSYKYKAYIDAVAAAKADKTYVDGQLSTKANTSSLATVATSGSYNHLSNKPTIPSKVSDLTNDSEFQTSSQVDARVQLVVGAAPAALDTLQEIAAQLENDQDAVNALTTVVSGKADKSYVDTQLSGKASYADVDSSINAELATTDTSYSIIQEFGTQPVAYYLDLLYANSQNAVQIDQLASSEQAGILYGSGTNIQIISYSPGDGFEQQDTNGDINRALTHYDLINNNILTSLQECDGHLRSLISNKVDKVAGKTLSTNDYTTAEKNKLAAISGSNTGDETGATIRTKLGVSTLSGSNTGDQTITLTGDVTGSGTGTFAATLGNTGVVATTYSHAKVTVDAKGRITSASNNRATYGYTGSGNLTVDLGPADDNYLYITLTGNLTLTINNINTAKALYIRVQQGGSGNYTITFPSSVIFPTAPSWNTAVGKVNTFAMVGSGTTSLDANSTKYA